MNNPIPVTKAQFVKTDTTTKGNWKGTYGQDGQVIASDATSPGPYATVNLPDALTYPWYVTDDPRGLQRANSGSRVAAAYYFDPSFEVDLSLFDNQQHGIALYFLDYDNWGRVQTIEILDANTGQSLDRQKVQPFGSGVYLVWNIKGM